MTDFIEFLERKPTGSGFFYNVLLQTGEVFMLTLVGSRYHFRRAVPVSLRPILGKSEIWISLGLSGKVMARRHAIVLHAHTSDLFRKIQSLIRNSESTKENSTNILQSFILQEQDNLKTLENIWKDKFRASELQIEAHEDEIRRLHETLCNASQSRQPEIQTSPTPPLFPLQRSETQQTSVTLSVAMLQFFKRKPVKSPDVQKDTTRTVKLFIKIIGDLPIKAIDGDIVSQFQDALYALPASHGKSGDLTIAEETERVVFDNLPTLSAKTVKNHFMRLSSLWADLVRRDMVPRNVWSGWSFDLTQKVVRRAWKPEEMDLLLRKAWPDCEIPVRTFHGITMVAAYTGMRLAEICNLRNEDIQEIDGILCFRICPHPEDNWSPKTRAGERIVPIHSVLLKWDILNFQKPDEKYLFPDLKTPEHTTRGADFSRAFSRHKTKIGLPAHVTFHGFRHTVSTLLRNQAGDIREIWIDALLGHEASHKSQGATTYFTGTEIGNLKRTMETLQYPGFLF